MRDAGFDVNEIAARFSRPVSGQCRIRDGLPFDDVKDDLKTDVNVGGGDATGRNRRDIRCIILLS